jgi:hypothetical protein
MRRFAADFGQANPVRRYAANLASHTHGTDRAALMSTIATAVPTSGYEIEKPTLHTPGRRRCRLTGEQAQTRTHNSPSSMTRR